MTDDQRLCEACDQPIPLLRLKALPDTVTCRGCSCEVPVTEDVPGVVDGVDPYDLRAGVQNLGERQ